MFNRLKLLYILLFLSTFFCGYGQKHYIYILDSSNVHISTLPTPVVGVHPPTDYSVISKPLAAEPFSSNCKLVYDAKTVHLNAVGRYNVIYGGDIPSLTYGRNAVPVFTKMTFDSSIFPVLIGCDFYSESNTYLHNESYLLVMPSNYKYYGSPTYYYNNNTIPREGIYIGGMPFDTRVINNNSHTQTHTKVYQNIHNVASNGKWFNFKVLLDYINGSLVMRQLIVDDNCILKSNVVIGKLSWLNNFRLGFAADDLAHNFSFITNYSPIIADFKMQETICKGDALLLNNTSIKDYCDSNLNYKWIFNGADIKTSVDETPSGITYSKSGVYPVTLISYDRLFDDTITKMITVIDALDVNLGNDTSICQGDSLALSVPDEGNILWQDGSTDSVCTVSKAGSYYVKVDFQNCSDSDTINISMLDKPKSILLTDTSICSGLSVVLTVDKGYDYLWSTGSVFEYAEIADSGSHWVMIYNKCDTLKNEFKLMHYDCNCDVAIPNAFTPNGDGINDEFYPLVDCITEEYHFIIFNRWGQVIYETIDENEKWDGKYKGTNVSPGVYFYILKYKDIYNPRVEEVLKGTVTLLR